MVVKHLCTSRLRIDTILFPADHLGKGSVQDSASVGHDAPFWNSLNQNVKNLHAVISGHGTLFSSHSSFLMAKLMTFRSW